MIRQFVGLRRARDTPGTVAIAIATQAAGAETVVIVPAHSLVVLRFYD